MEIKDRIGKSYWFDLPVADVVNARSFYEGLFDWKFLLLNEPTLKDYWVIQAGQELIGGIRQMTFEKPSNFSPVLYFTVDDLSKYSLRVKELGGHLVGSPITLGEKNGVYQWFRDREGNLIALWAPNNQ